MARPSRSDPRPTFLGWAPFFTTCLPAGPFGGSGSAALTRTIRGDVDVDVLRQTRRAKTARADRHQGPCGGTAPPVSRGRRFRAGLTRLAPDAMGWRRSGCSGHRVCRGPLGFLVRPFRNPSQDQSAAQMALVTPNLAQPLHIDSFAVQLYRGNPARQLGTIGKLCAAGQFNDNVRVLARLSGPAYCYLLALNPDGEIEFCPKNATHKPPTATNEIVYPADDDRYYGLTDGTGLQAFVLIASRRPLPAFGSSPHRASLSWKPTADASGVWKFDGRQFSLLAADVRGTERRVASAIPVALSRVCDALRKLPGVDAVEAVAFPVESPLAPKLAPSP